MWRPDASDARKVDEPRPQLHESSPRRRVRGRRLPEHGLCPFAAIGGVHSARSRPPPAVLAPPHTGPAPLESRRPIARAAGRGAGVSLVGAPVRARGGPALRLLPGSTGGYGALDAQMPRGL